LPPLDSFRAKLRDFGYVEGRNITIEVRFTEGRDERYLDFAADLARLPLDLIVAWGTPAALAAKNATSRIPIVFVAGEAVNTGIVTNLPRPEGNVAGFIALNADLEEKRLELLKEIVPNLARVAVLHNALNPLNRVNLEFALHASRKLSIDIETFEVRNSGEVERALRRLVDAHPDAAVLGSDTMLLTERRRIADTMRENRIPAVYPFREYLDVNGLIVYGANLSILFQGAAEYASRILKGEHPGNLPVQQATAFDLILNLKEAGHLGLTIPPIVLVRANEVIE
jgi:putative tryptophan/tyrosine transport system substrate-binding protein